MAIEFTGDKVCGGDYGGMIGDNPIEAFRTTYDIASNKSNGNEAKTGVCIMLTYLLNKSENKNMKDILYETGCNPNC